MIAEIIFDLARDRRRDIRGKLQAERFVEPFDALDERKRGDLIKIVVIHAAPHEFFGEHGGYVQIALDDFVA